MENVQHQNTQDYIALKEVPAMVPGRPAPQTVWLWTTKGVLGPSGSRVRLATIKAGRRRFTTQAWVSDFLTALNKRTEAA